MNLMPAFSKALLTTTTGDLNNIPLLKKVAKFGKPMIISTGGATMDDVRRAYNAIMPINRNLNIMQCTSGYPAPYEELNLRVIETFRREFREIVIGFSSHDSGISMPVVGYMLGARVFEKHFTLNRTWKGSDQAFSLEPGGLRRVVRDLERARMALGDGVKHPYASEIGPLNKMVKRIVAAHYLKVGTVLKADDLAFRIPTSAKLTADALCPYDVESFVGKVLNRDIAAEELVTRAAIGVEQQAAAG